MALRSTLFRRFIKSFRMNTYQNLIEQKNWYERCNSNIYPFLDGTISLMRSKTFNVFTLSIEPVSNIKEQKEDPCVRLNGGTDLFNGVLDAFLTLIRIVVIVSLLTGLFASYLITRFTYEHGFPKILRKAIEFLGPTFIKFGQWISTRKDLFPAEVCNDLSQLQRDAPPHSWTYTKNLLKATYGPNWRDLFVKFESEAPIGSGCCAQVYKAWIDLNARVEMTQEPRVSNFIEIFEYFNLGRFVVLFDKVLGSRVDFDKPLESEKLQAVAVKVLHPGIKGQLRRDLAIMRGICKCATYLIPDLYWLSLTDCIDEFSEIMENQVDMRREAGNLKRFAKNFSDKVEVAFPRAYVDFTNRGILVESFHKGIPISDYLDYGDTTMLRRLAKIGITTVFKMIFRDNFIHCDLHPGNILVEEVEAPTFGSFLSFWQRVAPKSIGDILRSTPRLVILDCGLVVSLDNRCRQNLRDVFRSVLMGNGELAAEYILEHSSHVARDPDSFKATIDEIVRTYLGNSVNLKNVNVSTVVTELFSAMVRHRVKQDGSFSSVILSIAVIEGLGRSLDPEIDIFTEVLPFVFCNSLCKN